MINALNGIVTEAGENGIVVNVGGVEYYLETSSKCSAFYAGHLNKDVVRILTVFQVREDSMTLYGFKDKGERECFIQLLKVPGQLIFKLKTAGVFLPFPPGKTVGPVADKTAALLAGIHRLSLHNGFLSNRL